MDGAIGSGINGRTISFADLFSGIGAMRMGFEQTRADAGLMPMCVGSSEIEGRAIAVYRWHWPGTPQLGDVRILARPGAIPRCDVLLAVFPCQDASSAGKRVGLEGDRGRLFSALAGAIGAARPLAFLLENVDDLATLDGGNLFEHFVEMMRRLTPKVDVIENVPGILSIGRPDGTPVMVAITRAFKGLGYAVGYRLLNAADFGDPQARMRVVILSWREGRPPSLIRTHDEHSRGVLPPWRTVRDTIGDLEDAPEHPDLWHRFVNSSPDYVERIGRTPVGQSVNPRYPEARYRNPPDQPAITVKENNGGVLVHYSKDRLMTPRELARLQGFPDSYRFAGSKSDVLRQIGNAVPVGLATAIGRAVLGMLGAGVPLAEGEP